MIKLLNKSKTGNKYREKRKETLTWIILCGGLCVALAMSTKNMLQSDVYYIILGGTFAIVFFTTVIQGMTIPRLYHSIEKKISHHHGAV